MEDCRGMSKGRWRSGIVLNKRACEVHRSSRRTPLRLSQCTGRHSSTLAVCKTLSDFQIRLTTSDTKLEVSWAEKLTSKTHTEFVRAITRADHKWILQVQQPEILKYFEKSQLNQSITHKRISIPTMQRQRKRCKVESPKPEIQTANRCRAELGEEDYWKLNFVHPKGPRDRAKDTGRQISRPKAFDPKTLKARIIRRIPRDMFDG